MRILRLALFLATIVAVNNCGSGPQSRLKDSDDIIRQWREFAPICAGYPAKANCDDGDMALFGGLLCAAGESLGCALVRDAQSSDGQWWRSPRRNPGNLGEKNSFSRDMAMGVLLYLQTTHDTDAAQRWLGWIQNNRPCAVGKIRGRCPVPGPHRFCRDDGDFRCVLTPGNWALMGRVWDTLGLPRSVEMKAFANSDDLVLPAQAAHSPTGYALHLISTEVWLKQRLNTSERARHAAEGTLITRQPGNLFFEFLRHGPAPTLRDQLKQICPSVSSSSSARNQWAWERDTTESAWHDSMGWDCIFMAKLLGI